MVAHPIILALEDGDRKIGNLRSAWAIYIYSKFEASSGDMRQTQFPPFPFGKKNSSGKNRSNVCRLMLAIPKNTSPNHLCQWLLCE
jgi:hypothetical protein